MILYHPAKDINHCIYRMICLLTNLKVGVSTEQLRLLDFYYSFPHLLKEIKPWPSDIKEYKKFVTKVPESFEKITNKKRLFFEMSEIQKTSIALLHAKGLVNDSLFRSGTIVLVNDSVPSKLRDVIENDPFLKTDLFRTITVGLTKTIWNGKQGLKFRTGILEYKYDE